jgi:hypothetical protein
MTPEQQAAGRAGLDAFLAPLIAAAPWYERGMISAHLTDNLRNGMVSAVADGGEPALNAYIDSVIAQQTSFREAIAAYMNVEFRARVAGAIEGPIEALQNQS